MARWSEVEQEVPELAARARVLFDAKKHKTLATLRKDGSPRISGTEAWFEDGELWFGSMARAVKALDLLRDPRFALHSATVDPKMAHGDAKLAGRAVETESDPSHLFRAELTELVVTRVGEPADHLVIEVWREGEGVRRIERR